MSRALADLLGEGRAAAGATKLSLGRNVSSFSAELLRSANAAADGLDWEAVAAVAQQQHDQKASLSTLLPRNLRDQAAAELMKRRGKQGKKSKAPPSSSPASSNNSRSCGTNSDANKQENDHAAVNA